MFEGYFDNGDSLIIKEGAGGVNSFGRAGGVVDTLGNYFEIQSTFFTGDGRKIGISFMKKFSSEPDSAQRESIIHTGSYPFGSSVVDSLVDGVQIVLDDTSGKRWRSNYGAQPGSVFTVTEHAENDFDLLTPSITSGTFRCVLYDSLGNSVTIDSASFTGRTIVYN